MTFKEALKKLKDEQLSSFVYAEDLGGLGGGECVGVEFLTSSNKWIVYYSERGSKKIIREFLTEHEAMDLFVSQARSLHAEYAEHYRK